MGCPTDVVLGDNLVFSVATHDPTLGTLTDADAVPSYRIYEDETQTPILTGTMAKLDDANTTGFYSESIACTTANGFESTKTYSVYIEATVNAVKGGISYGFKVNASSFGPGGISYTITVQNSQGVAKDGVQVWVTTDAPGANVVASGTSGTNGAVTFMLEAGSYYAWCQLAGENFTNPTAFTVP